MKALILNSGMGSRMGDETKRHPKCLTELKYGETILSRQLKLLERVGVFQIVMTTGLFEKDLIEYCQGLELGLHYTFVKNPDYEKTNYIYSIYQARKEVEGEILLLHGDLVFQESVLQKVLSSTESCMTVSWDVPLPEKDFKAVWEEDASGKKIIRKVGIEFFEQAVSAQPFYRLLEKDWKIWLKRIEEFCERGERSCYAENALNEVSGECRIVPLDVGTELCSEIDTIEDLERIRRTL